MDGTLRRRYSLSSDGTIVPDDPIARRKKFIIRLLTALHAAGNLTFRTEKLISRISAYIGINCNCTILPKRVILSFQDELVFDPTKSESYHFVLPGGLDFHKLILLEQLCFNLTQSEVIDFVEADKVLLSIEQAPPLYSKPFVAFCYFLASLASSMLFFGGNWNEGIWAGILGSFLVYGIDLLCLQLRGLSEISAFASSFSVAFVASLIDRYLYTGDLCLFGTMYGGVVWLLPGLTITISLLEVYSGMIVYGSSRLVYGVSQASQVGFGLAFGTLIFNDSNSIPVSFSAGCKSPLPEIWGIIFLPIAAISFSLIINSSMKEIPGIVVTSAVAQLSGYLLLIHGVNSGVIPFLCAILVTMAARLYAWAHGDERPLIYIIGGLLVLVPGGVGVGVRGSFTTVFQGNPNTGIAFTFNMIMIAITLAIGVFVSLIPTLKWFYSSSLGYAVQEIQERKLLEDTFLVSLEANSLSAKVSTKIPFSANEAEARTVLNPILMDTGAVKKVSSFDSIPRSYERKRALSVL
jgi:uncharacterized membrane protein YjjP (DUF1212 family)